MRMKMDLGGASYELDPAAISAIRYRAEYGDSIHNHLAACSSAQEVEGRLLRMCHCMIPEADRPELLDFAGQARQDKDFFQKALAARNALLGGDPRWDGGKEADGEPFDEYQVLALMAAAHLDTGLVYELPIMHLVAIVGRYFEEQNSDGTDLRPMTDEEMTRLYPRPRKE
ncbi:MAG TPA: hypothetical protein VN421_09465 [Pseudoflavonifractor sp.]|nr:hypothetical protein [Pseudoflavonifractor sp.]